MSILKRQLVISFSILLCVWTPSPAYSETLNDAINHMRATYPSLKAEREALNATMESLPQARSLRKPNISASLRSTTLESGVLRDTPFLLENSSSLTGEINLQQEIYRGGRTRLAIDQAKSNIQAAEYDYIALEQSLIVESVSAYMNVILQQDILSIREKNIDVLSVQETAAKARFEIGRVTRTDIAQSQTSLLRARAALTSARSLLISAQTNFQQFFGRLPENLTPPSYLENTPDSLEEALRVARRNNPLISAQQARVRTATLGVKSRKGEKLPSASLNLSYGTSEGLTRSFISRDDLRLTGTVTVPLSSGGFLRSRVREGVALRERSRYDLATIKLFVERETQSRWAALQAAKAEFALREEQIIAAELAYTGVIEEQKLGRRSTFQVLNIERDLIDARLSAAAANANIIVESARLLEITGKLSQSF